MKLAALLEGIPFTSPLLQGWDALDLSGLDYDSRRIQPGFGFFAFPGARTDGRLYAADALARGALAVFSESPSPPGFRAPWIQLGHARRALAEMSRRLYGRPDEALRLAGVTGTNGKTTTVYAIDAMLRHAGRVTGMAGTIVCRIADRELSVVNTTPESLDLIRAMSDVLRAGGTHFTFEVSSHALALGRVSGFSFHSVVFTNLTQDHLDFHGSMEEYFAAKEELFLGAGGPAPKFAILNADDSWAGRIRTRPETARWTYGLSAQADFRAVSIDAGFHGLRFDIEHPGGRQRIVSPLCGLINVYNLTAAFAAGLSLGLDAAVAGAGLAACQAVPGRFERIDLGQPFLVVVDYAHTDDALRNVIAAARTLQPRRVITLFGCGGNRDALKRPRMGEAAASLSDLVIVTSDNPRDENPLGIINDALVGVRRTDTPHFVEPDRGRAIRLALEQAAPGDIVLLAGKGHETSQVIGRRSIPFDDREAARSILRSFGYGAGTEAAS